MSLTVGGGSHGPVVARISGGSLAPGAQQTGTGGKIIAGSVGSSVQTAPSQQSLPASVPPASSQIMVTSPIFNRPVTQEEFSGYQQQAARNQMIQEAQAAAAQKASLASRGIEINPASGKPYGTVTAAPKGVPSSYAQETAREAQNIFLERIGLKNPAPYSEYSATRQPSTPGGGSAAQTIAALGFGATIAAAPYAAEAVAAIPAPSQALGLTSGIASGIVNVGSSLAGYQAYIGVREKANEPIGSSVAFGQSIPPSEAQNIANIGTSQGFIRGAVPFFISEEKFIQQTAPIILSKGYASDIGSAELLSSQLFRQDQGYSVASPFGPASAEAFTLLGINRATEIGGRQAFANYFSRLEAKGGFIAEEKAGKFLFQRGATIIGAQGVIEGIGDISVYRASRGETPSGGDVAFFGLAGGAIAGAIGGGAVALPYLSGTKQTLTRASVSAVNILDPFEKPGDIAADIAESSFISRGGRVAEPVTTLESGFVRPGVITKFRGGEQFRGTVKVSTVSDVFTPSSSPSSVVSPSKSSVVVSSRSSVVVPSRSSVPVGIRTGVPTLVPTAIPSLVVSPSKTLTPSNILTGVPVKTNVPISIKTDVPVGITTSVPVNVTVPNVGLPFIGGSLPQGGKGKGFVSTRTGGRGFSFAPDFTAAFFGQKAGRGVSRAAGSAVINPIMRRLL